MRSSAENVVEEDDVFTWPYHHLNDVVTVRKGYSGCKGFDYDSARYLYPNAEDRVELDFEAASVNRLIDALDEL